MCKVTEDKDLHKCKVFDTMEPLVIIQTNDLVLARRLADHHLGLAQVYRMMAGMEPLPTGSQMRKMVANANR